MPDLRKITILRVDYVSTVYEGVFARHSDGAMHIFTPDPDDPAYDRIHVGSYPYSGMLWWVEKATPDAEPYVIPTDAVGT